MRPFPKRRVNCECGQRVFWAIPWPIPEAEVTPESKFSMDPDGVAGEGRSHFDGNCLAFPQLNGWPGWVAIPTSGSSGRCAASFFAGAYANGAVSKTCTARGRRATL